MTRSCARHPIYHLGEPDDRERQRQSTVALTGRSFWAPVQEGGRGHRRAGRDAVTIADSISPRHGADAREPTSSAEVGSRRGSSLERGQHRARGDRRRAGGGERVRPGRARRRHEPANTPDGQVGQGGKAALAGQSAVGVPRGRRDRRGQIVAVIAAHGGEEDEVTTGAGVCRSSSPWGQRPRWSFNAFSRESQSRASAARNCAHLHGRGAQPVAHPASLARLGGDDDLGQRRRCPLRARPVSRPRAALGHASRRRPRSRAGRPPVPQLARSCVSRIGAMMPAIVSLVRTAAAASTKMRRCRLPSRDVRGGRHRDDRRRSVGRSARRAHGPARARWWRRPSSWCF